MELKLLKEMLGDSQLRKTVTHPVLNDILTRLEDHGEVMFRLQTGKEVALHLGDRGMISGDILTLLFRNGETHNFPASQIEDVWTHLSYYDN